MKDHGIQPDDAGAYLSARKVFADILSLVRLWYYTLFFPQDVPVIQSCTAQIVGVIQYSMQRQWKSNKPETVSALSLVIVTMPPFLILADSDPGYYAILNIAR